MTCDNREIRLLLFVCHIMDGFSLIVAKTANSLVPYFTDEADIRSKRSMETKDSPPVTASTPVFKTLKAALLYPARLREKYSGSLNNSLGGVENYLLVVANMVCIVFLSPLIAFCKINQLIVCCLQYNNENNRTKFKVH